jgi:hypothetical protein
MMADPDKTALVQTGKLTAIGGGAVAVIIMQVVASVGKRSWKSARAPANSI